jgi:putative FmdB family regulatory protein
MPIYEYECGGCGHHLESFQKMSDAPLTDCPKCHKSTLQKQISAAGFQLKGTGWYATDFRNKGKPAASQSDTKSDSGTSTSSDSGTSNSGDSKKADST